MLVYQAPTAVMMVRPDHFGYNPETAASNSFQRSGGKENIKEIRAQAAIEFEGLVATLKTTGVEVIQFGSDDGLATPDAVFPNNWVSFHHDGKVVLYPMMAPNRRLERRLGFITALEKQYLFEVSEIVDLSHFEEQGHFLEGTGSMVIDYSRRTVYANHSPRTSQLVLNEVARILKYNVCLFTAVDSAGQDIYHTNVLMCMGSSFAVVCLDALKNIEERNSLESSLSKSGHQVVEINHDQMSHFAGNMMELESKNGESVLAMSESAYKSLTDEQLKILGKYSKLVYSPIDTIEKYGGGSVRCMLAGIYLSRK